MKTYNKKIAIVISSLEVGGAEKMVLDLIREIKDKVEVGLFVIKGNSNSIYDKEAKRLGIDIVYFNHRIKIFSPLVAIRVKKELDRFKPDIIHTHLKSSSYIYFYNLFNKNFRWIHTIHTIAKVDTKIIRRRLFKRLYNNNRIELVAVSNTVKVSTLEIFKNARVIVIKNGIDLSRFSYEKNKSGINLISVGRLEKVKNHKFMLTELASVLKEQKTSTLYLIGYGKQKKKVDKLISELEIDKYVEIVRYTNMVHEYLNLADIYLSTSFYEGMPLSIIEAMASGLIVVATKAASDVVIDNYNGYIIDLNKGSLRNKLKEIMKNINKFDGIRKGALDSVKEYSVEKMANSYLDLYLEDLK